MLLGVGRVISEKTTATLFTGLICCASDFVFIGLLNACLIACIGSDSFSMKFGTTNVISRSSGRLNLKPFLP